MYYGLYLHIPFCAQACSYCNFHFSTSLGAMNDMVQALQAELTMRTMELDKNDLIASIYFGGGTPGLLPAPALHSIMRTIQRYYACVHNPEITLEVNPENVSAASIREWKAIGINRVSMGIQSFHDASLMYMRRRYKGSEAQGAAADLMDSGLRVSADILMGLPEHLHRSLYDDLAKIIALGIPHLSCYLLTVEKKTLLHYQIEKKQYAPPCDQLQRNDFLLANTLLSKQGYDHYELSNYALPGHRAQHNNAYWQGQPYIGIGPSAHSFNGRVRTWNVSNNPIYIRSVLQEKKRPYEAEVLTEKEWYNEFILRRLRIKEGIFIPSIAAQFSEKLQQHFHQQLRQGLPREWFSLKNDTFALSVEGRLFIDAVARHFLYV